MTLDNIGKLERNIGSGTIFPGQYTTFEFLLEGGYFYYIVIFPEFMNRMNDKLKIREEFNIIIYDPDKGCEWTDNSNNEAPFCRIALQEKKLLKVAILRDTVTSSSSHDEIPYKVVAFGYKTLGKDLQTKPYPEIYWLDK